MNTRVAAGPHNLQGRVRAPSPSTQGGGNQSCLTADIWFHSECGLPHRSKGQHTHTARGPEGRMVAPVYTRHLVKY